MFAFIPEWREVFFLSNTDPTMQVLDWMKPPGQRSHRSFEVRKGRCPRLPTIYSLTTGQESCFLTLPKLTFPVSSNTSARGQQRRPRKPVATVGRTRWHSMLPSLLLALRHPLTNGRPEDSPRTYNTGYTLPGTSIRYQVCT